MAKTVAEIRAEIEAAKVVAMRNFKRDWGTDNVGVVMEALAQDDTGQRQPSGRSGQGSQHDPRRRQAITTEAEDGQMTTTMTLSRARDLADLQRLYVRTGDGRLSETSATAALATLVGAQRKGDVKRIAALRLAVDAFPKHNAA